MQDSAAAEGNAVCLFTGILTCFEKPCFGFCMMSNDPYWEQELSLDKNSCVTTEKKLCPHSHSWIYAACPSILDRSSRY